MAWGWSRRETLRNGAMNLRSCTRWCPGRSHPAGGFAGGGGGDSLGSRDRIGGGAGVDSTFDLYGRFRGIGRMHRIVGAADWLECLVLFVVGLSTADSYCTPRATRIPMSPKVRAVEERIANVFARICVARRYRKALLISHEIHAPLQIESCDFIAWPCLRKSACKR